MNIAAYGFHSGWYNQRVQKISRVIACIFKRDRPPPDGRGSNLRVRPFLRDYYRYYYQLKRVSRLVYRYNYSR